MPDTFSPKTESSSPSQAHWLAALVFVVSVAAFVALEVTGNDTDGLLVLVGPVVAALLVTGQVRSETAKQNMTLDAIREQTNGVLNRRMREAVETVLKETGLVTTEATVTPPPVADPPAPAGPSPADRVDLPLGRHAGSSS